MASQRYPAARGPESRFAPTLADRARKMTSPSHDPTQPENVTTDRSALKRRRLITGLIIAAIGALPLYAGFYYATELARRPEFRSAVLENVMGVCFWGGALFFVVGIGFILWSQQK
jgi:hypothetical protein